MIKQVGEGIYEVPSGTSHGKHYVVNLTHAGRPECTCTNWAVTRNKRKSVGQAPDPYECKHIREALRADPNLLKKQRAAEAEEYRQRAAAEKAEKQAQADKMKAELLKMRNELVGKPTPQPIETPVTPEPPLVHHKGAAVPIPKREEVDLMAQLEAAIIAQKHGQVTVVCPTEPDPDNGCEGCGETFTATPEDDYVECPSCGLAFDVTRAQALETM
jgi:hypothetical protein